MRFIRFREPELRSPRALSQLLGIITEGLFKIASWLVLIGALRYFGDKSGSDYLKIAAIALWLLLIVHVYVWLIARIEFDIIPRERRTTFWRRFVDAFGNAVIVYGFYWLASHFIGKAVEAVAAAQS